MPFDIAPQPTHEQMSLLASDYAQAVLNRQALVAGCRARLRAIADEMAPAIHEAVAAERDRHDALAAAVEQAPELFSRPRTRTTAGIRYGYLAGKPKIDIPDEAKTIALIRKHLPEGQQVLLIRTKESVHKPAILDLTLQDQRRLGIRQIPGEDSVVVKPVSDDTDRLVQALLDDAAHQEDPAP